MRAASRFSLPCAYEVGQTRAVPIDDALLREFQLAVDQAQAWGVVPQRVAVAEAVDQLQPRPGGVTL